MGRSNKKGKTQVVFDENDRANYLLGFRKRKQERKKKARTELDDMIRKEKKRHKELKAQSILDERKKAGLPMFDEKLNVSKRDVIDTGEHEITISDFSSAPRIESDGEDDEKLKRSEKTDAEINQTKVKITKECTLINERLSKLEKQKRSLEMTSTKKKKNYLKSKQNAKNSKSSKKYSINNKKIKKRLKNKK